MTALLEPLMVLCMCIAMICIDRVAQAIHCTLSELWG